MKVVVSSQVMLFVIFWFVALTIGRTTVASSIDGYYPILEFSPRQRVEGGYRIHSAIDRVSVIFPDIGWKRLDFTYPGGGYLIDPATGTTFRYDAIRFGRKPKELLLWGWSVHEHRWAESWLSKSVSDNNQNEFLLEWLQRTIVKRGINHPDNLSIVVPVLSSDLTQAQLCPLHLAYQPGSTQVETELVEGHSFSHVKVPTYIVFRGQHRHFETDVWISYFRYVPKFEQWQFFVAFSHVPTDLSPEGKKQMRESFSRTLRSLSITPFKGE